MKYALYIHVDLTRTGRKVAVKANQTKACHPKNTSDRNRRRTLDYPLKHRKMPAANQTKQLHQRKAKV